MRRHSQRGFTIIEALIAAAIAVIILGGLILIVNNSFKQSSHTTTHTRSQTNTQAITRMLTDDLRSAIINESRAHTTSNPCALISTSTHWITYCNTPDGAHRAQTPKDEQPTAPPAGQPANSNTTLITDVGGSINISLSGTQFLTRIQPSPRVTATQLAITTRIGGN